GVLQLIAEAEGAPGLVVAGPRPQTAADRLVEQPAIHDQVERVVRRADLDDVEVFVPRAPDRRQACIGRLHATVPLDEIARALKIDAVTQQKHDAARYGGREREHTLQCGARIEAGAESLRELT